MPLKTPDLKVRSIDGQQPSEEDTAAKVPSFKDKVSRFAYSADSAAGGSSKMAPRKQRVARSTPTETAETKTSEPAPTVEDPPEIEGAAEESQDAVEDASPNSDDESTSAAKRKRAPTITEALMGSAAVKRSKVKKADAGPTRLVNNLRDTVRPGLILISVGLNPGKLTGEKGYPYSHKSNKYWPGLYKAGITPVQHKPEDAESLMDMYGLGHTNIVPDIATEGESGLSTQELLDGAATLDEKIRELKPQAVMLLGRGIWYKWMQYKTGNKFDPKKKPGWDVGLQNEKYWVGRHVVKGKVEYEGARTFVLESPSGQAAIAGEKRIANWKVAGDWFTPKREEWMKAREE